MSEQASTPDLTELTQRIFDAVDRGDLDSALVAFAPDAVWDSQVLGASFEGHEAIRAFLERWTEVYEAFEVQTQDISDLGGGVVLCVFMNRSRPTEEAGEPSLRFAMVVVFVDGLVWRVKGSEDIGEARAEAERLAVKRS